MSKVIILKQLRLHNFKGIKDFTLDTGSGNIDVFADNGAGKTTLFDAFTWLLFDKDSHDISKFNVQPLDAQGNVIHMLDTEVEGVLNIDGKDIILRKVLKEKWVKPKGKPEAELKGTETLYYIDEVPAKQSEYKQYISNIIDENVFKLITSPTYFSLVLKWQDRRKVLLDMVGNIDDAQVISSKPDLKPLETLLQDKDIETLKKSIAARRKKLNDDIKGIPPRVDELTRSIRNDLDFNLLDYQRSSITDALRNIDEKLMDSSKANEDKLNDRKQLYELQSKLMEIEQKAKEEAQKPYYQLQNDLQKAKIDYNEAQNKLTFKKNIVQGFQNEIGRLSSLNEDLREQWHEENSKTFEMGEDEFICPTCKRPFDDEDIEAKRQELLENFNVAKAERLKAINGQGLANKVAIDRLKKQITDINIEKLEANVKESESLVNELKQKIDSFKSEINLEGNTEYQAIKKEIAELEAKLQRPAQMNVEIEQLQLKKVELNKDLADVMSKLSFKDANKKVQARITELTAEEKQLAQQIAELERQEYLADEFTKAKVEMLESTINSKFKYVTFKLFSNLVNGRIEECCEPMVNGVPFSTNLNSGARINAGLDIINTLCNYYQIQAPIFVDNSESVTELIPIESQLIRLVVSKPDKVLRVERG